jgi:hypothetical protein
LRSRSENALSCETRATGSAIEVGSGQASIPICIFSLRPMYYKTNNEIYGRELYRLCKCVTAMSRSDGERVTAMASASRWCECIYW